MKTYRCPTCGKALTQREYEKALKIQGAREAHFHRREDELRQKSQAREQRLKDREKRLLRRMRDEATRIRQKERTRAERSNADLKRSLQRANDRIRLLEKGATPQTEGLEFEEKLVARLRKEFPTDDIQHKGKGGDVLHMVRFGKEMAGVIIYECKRTPALQGAHIAQALRAKQSREADFAVLVTTAKKRGFSGFSQMQGVWVVSPLAAIPLASLLREHLIEMLRAKIGKEKRAAIAQQLMRYIDSPQFKNPVAEIAQRAEKLQEMVRREAKDHFRVWGERWENYQTIHWNTAQVQKNLQMVLHGDTPKAICLHKPQPLQLPAPKQR
ncbi:MAG: DUF2130 domain-containing protein [Elusimicrobia bacterium]|nr:DUF2130 domain-containing protein [Elusimicrobiota bacterium]